MEKCWNRYSDEGDDLGNKTIKRIYEAILDFFFPPSCPICGETVGKNVEPCEKCKIKIAYINYPTCLKCGKEISDEDEEFCKDCRENKRSYQKGFPVIKYIEPMDESMAAFKYRNKRTYAKFYAREIVRKHGREMLDIKPDILVPVPVHKSKLHKRGYNQAEVLARELATYLNVPVEPDLIKRNIKTSPQKELGTKAREENIKKAFNSTDKIVKYRCALLVDDIYTTGATIEACTKILHEQGIKDVYYTSVCIGKGE